MLIAVSSFGEASAGSFLTTPAEAILNYAAQYRQIGLRQGFNPNYFRVLNSKTQRKGEYILLAALIISLTARTGQ